MSNEKLSTGLPGLDRMLKGIMPGDNLVWQVNDVEDYLPFVKPLCEHARKTDRKLVYFRFAKHSPLVSKGPGVEVHHLRPEDGFEPFIDGIHKAIQISGSDACYLFDCLSVLAADWFSDRMLGNIFLLTCPYLYDLGALGYFALLRNRHSFHATSPIAETTQVLIDVYSHNEKLYVHPLKVQHRFSPTIHMLHVWENDKFVPVTDSMTISGVLSACPWSRLESSSFRLGPWSSTFLHAEEVLHALQRGECDPEKAREVCCRLLRMVISRDERVLRLAEKYLSLADIVNVRMHMIGTGLIGGKAVGLLLARAILKQAGERWKDLLEPHDTFFLGSDLFYTFLVQNGCWWVRQKQKDPATFLEGAEDARRHILTGTFPDYINEQFADMLDYFGQYPIIVRSSTILEDAFDSSLAGKCKSVFCVNQGPRHERLEDFMSAVRTIYASAMSKEALNYRAQRGLLRREEQMALIVQRVSGNQHGKYYYPQVAGVGLSFNPYAWSEYIDPQAGILRLVFGLGTRAVDRVDDDYTRIVALNDPTRRPEADFDEVKQHTQHRVDVLSLEDNRLVSVDFMDIAEDSPKELVDMFSSQDEKLERSGAKRAGGSTPRVLTFDRLLSKTPFVDDIHEILRILRDAYDCHVDIEFTANFVQDGTYEVNLLQCRPLQVREGAAITDPPENIAKEDLVLEAHGAVIGKCRASEIDRIVYVVPEVYGQLPVKDRHSIAQVIARVNKRDRRAERKAVMLIGPGRWGTASAELGVPVSFSQINGVSVLCEIVTMRDGLVPDVSLGTHFFSELVEEDILYLALFPDRKSSFLNKKFLEESPNKLAELLPSDSRWSEVVRVIDPRDFVEDAVLKLNANTFKQRVVCYLEK